MPPRHRVPDPERPFVPNEEYEQVPHEPQARSRGPLSLTAPSHPPPAATAKEAEEGDTRWWWGKCQYKSPNDWALDQHCEVFIGGTPRKVPSMLEAGGDLEQEEASQAC